MGFRDALRAALRMQPYSFAVADRKTARQELSLRLAREHVEGRSLLDIGCDGGWFERCMEGVPDVLVVGVEPDGGALATARMNAPRARFVQASALALPFPDASFDAAVLFEVIEHLPRGSEPRALAELRRVLPAGAPLLLSTPFAHPLATALDPAWYFGHRHYSRERLRALLDVARFRVEREFVRGGAGEIAGMWLLYLAKHLLGAEAPLKARTETARKAEFLGEREGFTNLFVVARAR